MSTYKISSPLTRVYAYGKRLKEAKKLTKLDHDVAI